MNLKFFDLMLTLEAKRASGNLYYHTSSYLLNGMETLNIPYHVKNGRYYFHVAPKPLDEQLRDDDHELLNYLQGMPLTVYNNLDMYKRNIIDKYVDRMSKYATIFL